jgi:hypothetical protein
MAKVFMFRAWEVSPNGETAVKCGCCLYIATNVFVLAKTREEALALAKSGVYLCGECMAEFLAEKGYEIA